jgi:cell division protein FtsI (penicillin-binding protein 3)
MAKPTIRIGALQFFLLLGGLALLGRAGYLQLVKGEEYGRQARAERTVRLSLEAPRGAIYDHAGTPLAVSLERYRLGVNPAQVRRSARDSVLRFAASDLGIATGRLRQALSGERTYFYAHGPFTAGQVERIRRIRGVELTPVFRREYPSGPLARPLIGALSPDLPVGESGLERFLDSLLSGVPGEAVLLKDAAGRTYESPGRVVRLPVRGHDVVLTIDRELQAIAEDALREAFAEFRPRRGDVVFLDPRSGELLAAASRESSEAGGDLASASFFVTAFEPGSTAKPFTAAALLALARIDSADAVSGEGGTWVMATAGGRGRTIRDDHPVAGPITLARAVQVSSNVAMVKFGGRLRAEEHYDMLRAFGFGSPTGIEFGAEAPGSLPRPHHWRTGWHGASAAMGYGFEVTPIQLAAAYGAIAHDGLLLAPSVIKEIRAPDGTVSYRHRPTVVRRVVTSRVATRLRAFLALAAADSGTGGRGQVKGGVLGKTGTARLVRNRVYTDQYGASFAGIYPASDPQLVVVVRIEAPRGGAYYGGLVAAPLTARMLRQALAARRTALDRAALAEGSVPVETVQVGARLDRPAVEAVPWPLPERRPTAVPAVVPDVIGSTVRAAALALHRSGFRVQLEGSGRVTATIPAAGDSAATGQTVTVIAGRVRSP